MFQLKMMSVVFALMCLSNSCTSTISSQPNQVSPTETPPILSNQTLKNTNQGSDNFDTNKVNVSKTKPVENISSDETIKLPYQKKARRKNIQLPDDCERAVVEGSENWKIRRGCGIALYDVQPYLPKTHIIGAASAKADPDTPTIECDYVTKQNSQGHFDFYEYRAKFYPLSPNKYLVEVLCSAGAYNEINAYLLYDESAIPVKAEVLEFPSIAFTHGKESERPETFEKTIVETVGGRYFNPKTKKLTVLVKGRGVGDFGQYARYSFPNGKPKLEEYRADFKEGCPCYQAGDVIKSPPKKWKRYYPK